MKSLRASVLSFLALLLISGNPVSAGAAHEFNWMREYVQMREQALLQYTPEAARQPADRAAAPRIVGGTVAPAGLHKFQVALLNKKVSNDYDAQFCGGTLIGDRYILTAAHCSEGRIKAENVAVVAGVRTLSANSKGNRIKVEQILLHPNWDPVTFDYDVAIWRLSSPVSNIAPAGLVAGNTDPVPSTMSAVTGWGATAYNKNLYPRQLRAVSVPVVDRTACNSVASYDGSITERMFCAGAAGKDSCQGDSGGPITASPSNTTLIGVVSWGNACGWKRYPGVYTRLGNPDIHDWIVHTMAGNGTKPTR